MRRTRIDADPLRTPTFTLFANPDLFVKTSNTSCGGPSVPVCIDFHFAWSHGDNAPDIAQTWIGLVGPGVRKHGVQGDVWTDHTDVRPTLLSLVGLKDSYEPDGRMIVKPSTRGLWRAGLASGRASCASWVRSTSRSPHRSATSA